MPALVRPPDLETEMPQQRLPDAVGDVLVVERLAFAVAEDELESGRVPFSCSLSAS